MPSKPSSRNSRKLENSKSSDKELEKLFKGIEKLLDKNSKEYKEIIEKNREAWEKLAKM